MCRGGEINPRRSREVGRFRRELKPAVLHPAERGTGQNPKKKWGLQGGSRLRGSEQAAMSTGSSEQPVFP